jgi:hypothetical protein
MNSARKKSAAHLLTSRSSTTHRTDRERLDGLVVIILLLIVTNVLIISRHDVGCFYTEAEFCFDVE